MIIEDNTYENYPIIYNAVHVWGLISPVGGK